MVSAAGLHIEDISFCGLTDNLPRFVKYKRSLYKRCGKTLRYPLLFLQGLILSATLAEVSEPLRFADLYPLCERRDAEAGSDDRVGRAAQDAHKTMNTSLRIL